MGSSRGPGGRAAPSGPAGSPPCALSAPGGATGGRRGSLVGDEQRQDDGEEGDTLDERREDDRDAADLGVRLGLAGDALRGPGADVTDADTGADGGETSTDAGSGLGDVEGGFGLLNGVEHGCR